jgi:hypothetical protein
MSLLKLRSKLVYVLRDWDAGTAKSLDLLLSRSLFAGLADQLVHVVAWHPITQCSIRLGRNKKAIRDGIE